MYKLYKIIAYLSFSHSQRATKEIVVLFSVEVCGCFMLTFVTTFHVHKVRVSLLVEFGIVLFSL